MVEQGNSKDSVGDSWHGDKDNHPTFQQWLREELCVV